MATPNNMSIRQALTLAALVLEFEAESSQVTEWRAEMEQAHQVIKTHIGRTPAGDFFLSAPARKRAGRKSNLVEV